ncbi:MAG: DcrB-related protein, partial [Atribacterota bacterium]|nr:DcrB-related protein [Atribacterota bacterium]
MYKKNTFILIVILVLSLSFIAYGQNFVPYQNPQKGFSIQVPAGWQQSAQDFYGQEVIYFISPMESQQDFFQENISIMIFPLQYQMDLDTLANMYTQQSQSQIPNLQVVQSQNITIGNVPAKYALYTGSMQQMNMAFLVVYIINQNQAYILQCTSDANKYQQYQAVFSQVLGSFSFMAVQPTPF